MALVVDCILGRVWEESGMTLGHMAVGDDTKPIWDMAKLGSSLAPGSCWELSPGLNAVGSSPGNHCPGER